MMPTNVPSAASIVVRSKTGTARLEHAPRQILGVGRHAQSHRGEILFVELREVRCELRGFTDENGQEACGLGIKRPAMADLRRAEQAAKLRHHLERRHARSLLDGQDAGRVTTTHGAVPFSAPRTASSRTAVASSSVPRSVHPAAFS